jgi:polyferredoxin
VAQARYFVSPVSFYRTPPPAGTAAGARSATAEPASAHRAPRAKKKFQRRRGDRSQLVRHAVQAAFLLLNLWIGARFYFFVRYYETGGASIAMPRPAGVEGWLPIAGLMNLKYFLTTGLIPDLHPAGFFLLTAFVAMSFAFRKAFCSWLCPVGTVSEWLWQGGREIFGRNVTLPRWLDIPLRGLKYLLLGFFLWAILQMPAHDIVAFLESPYGVIADVKMLNFFRHLGTGGAVTIAVLVALSVFVKNAWCRYLCPYGGLLGLVALVSPTRIRRNPDACIDCAKCAKACPASLPVDRLLSVKSAECTGCLECVAACPAQGALHLSLTRRRRVPAMAVAIGVVTLFLGLVGYAKASGHWQTMVDEAVYFQLIPRASTFGHPPVSGRPE